MLFGSQHILLMEATSEIVKQDSVMYIDFTHLVIVLIHETLAS